MPLLSALPKLLVEMPDLARAAPAAHPGWGLVEALAVVWLAGALLLAFRVLRSESIVRNWLEDAEAEDTPEWQGLLGECARALGMKKVPPLRLKPGLSSPVAAGIACPVVVMPTAAGQWSRETRKMALLHELAHVQRRDLWVRFAAGLACALHWYNPLVWWLRAKLLVQCEYACDARVVTAGADPRSYVRALCDVVESATAGARPRAALAMADHAPLRLRVNRLIRGAPAGKRWLAVAAALATTATALGLSLVRPVPADAAPDPAAPVYPRHEIDLRHSADPFPG